MRYLLQFHTVMDKNHESQTLVNTLHHETTVNFHKNEQNQGKKLILSVLFGHFTPNDQNLVSESDKPSIFPLFDHPSSQNFQNKQKTVNGYQNFSIFCICLFLNANHISHLKKKIASTALSQFLFCLLIALNKEVTFLRISMPNHTSKSLEHHKKIPNVFLR